MFLSIFVHFTDLDMYGTYPNLQIRIRSELSLQIRIWIRTQPTDLDPTQHMDPDPYPAYGSGSIPSLWIQFYTYTVPVQPMDPDLYHTQPTDSDPNPAYGSGSWEMGLVWVQADPEPHPLLELVSLLNLRLKFTSSWYHTQVRIKQSSEKMTKLMALIPSGTGPNGWKLPSGAMDLPGREIYCKF